MANCLIYSGLYMDFVTHSHRHAIAIVKEPQFKADWESFCNVLKSITDSDIIKYFETPDQRQAKSISEAINHLINGRMIKAGWNAQSHIFGDERFRDKRWTLDFSKPGEAFGKGGFSVEVAFNHGEGTAWISSSRFLLVNLTMSQKKINSNQPQLVSTPSKFITHDGQITKSTPMTTSAQ